MCKTLVPILSEITIILLLLSNIKMKDGVIYSHIVPKSAQ